MTYEPGAMYRITLAEGEAAFTALHLYGGFLALRRGEGKIKFTAAEIDAAHDVTKIG